MPQTTAERTTLVCTCGARNRVPSHFTRPRCGRCGQRLGVQRRGSRRSRYQGRAARRWRRRRREVHASLHQALDKIALVFVFGFYLLWELT